jgi:C4-dicarboxylate transporter DctM subunit
MSGTAVSDAGGLGSIEIQAMRENGFDNDFACCVTAASSTLGPIIPPSIPLVVYATVSGASVGALFIAGILPGLVMALIMMSLVFFYAKKRHYPKTKFPTGREFLKALKEGFLPLMAPVILLVGIYGGVFTPTEAAAVAIFYGLFVGIFIYRTIDKFSIFVEVLVESVKATAVIMFVVTCAGLYAWVASTVGLVERGAAVLLSLSENPWVLLLLINVILFVAGMLLDAISIYYVLLPFLLPIMAHFGWDPVWFGVMMTINLALGQVTPPVAVNLYVGAKISGLTMEQITPPVLPMLAAATLALVVIVLFPDITLFFPRMLGL